MLPTLECWLLQEFRSGLGILIQRQFWLSISFQCHSLTVLWETHHMPHPLTSKGVQLAVASWWGIAVKPSGIQVWLLVWPRANTWIPLLMWPPAPAQMFGHSSVLNLVFSSHSAAMTWISALGRVHCLLCFSFQEIVNFLWVDLFPSTEWFLIKFAA